MLRFCKVYMKEYQYIVKYDSMINKSGWLKR